MKFNISELLFLNTFHLTANKLQCLTKGIAVPLCVYLFCLSNFFSLFSFPLFLVKQHTASASFSWTPLLKAEDLIQFGLTSACVSLLTVVSGFTLIFIGELQFRKCHFVIFS